MTEELYVYEIEAILDCFELKAKGSGLNLSDIQIINKLEKMKETAKK